MKHISGLIPILMLFLISSCEGSGDEVEEICLPTSMSALIIQGTNTTKIIADFDYLPESDLLDHITWSNHQTHYFEYDDSNRLSVVRQLKVKEKVQDELWFRYDGQLVSEVILVRKNLDYAYLEPVDSIYTGYLNYEYEGKQIIAETEYRAAEGVGTINPVREVSYEYDGNGNILNTSTIYLDKSGSDETAVMTYDSDKHPFSALIYYFTGESFVNNQLTRSVGNMDYTYDLTLNSRGYPEIIYEKLGSSNTQIIRYSYMVR
ncbi:MAG: hypothetical protein GY790_01135 [Bacteroidetes bacterium]|nr:hypothetical protein [Bacteroidota bacterium]